MNIALLFGSFNPPHRGHTAIARYVLERGLASEVWFVVSPQNPLKSPSELAPFDHRLAMVRIATQGDPRMRVCDIEDALPRPSYTFNTLVKLKRLFPSNTFTILAGSDIADQLGRWYRSDKVRQLVDFLIYPRGGGDCSDTMRDAPQIDVDATRCRNLEPEFLANWLDSGVVEYIFDNALYCQTPDQLFAHAMHHYRANRFGEALNLFVAAATPAAQQMAAMTREILAFRHTDIYNP